MYAPCTTPSCQRCAAGSKTCWPTACMISCCSHGQLELFRQLLCFASLRAFISFQSNMLRVRQQKIGIVCSDARMHAAIHCVIQVSQVLPSSLTRVCLLVITASQVVLSRIIAGRQSISHGSMEHKDCAAIASSQITTHEAWVLYSIVWQSLAGLATANYSSCDSDLNMTCASNHHWRTHLRCRSFRKNNETHW